MPAFSSAYAVAGIGAVSIQIGSAPRTLRWWMRARGVRPCSFSARSDTTRIAAAASEIWLETAAVSRPPSTSAGSVGHLLERRLAARAFVDGDVAERHDLALEAALVDRGWIARVWLSSANRSISSREMSHFSAIISAPRNCDTSWVP